MVGLIPEIAEVERIEKREEMDWQIVRYAPWQGFSAHYDEVGGGETTIPMPMTFMVYLNDLPRGAGGRTQFFTDGRDVLVNDPAKVVSVKPRKGDLLMWTTCTRDGKVDSRTYHKGEFLNHSEKWILNRFFTHPHDINIKKCKKGISPSRRVAGQYYL